MAIIRSLRVSVTANTGKFKKGMDGAKKKAAEFSKTLKNVNAAAQFAKFAGAAGMLEGTFKALSVGVSAFKGDTQAAVDAIKSFPFGVGAAVSAFEELISIAGGFKSEMEEINAEMAKAQDFAKEAAAALRQTQRADQFFRESLAESKFATKLALETDEYKRALLQLEREFDKRQVKVEATVETDFQRQQLRDALNAEYQARLGELQAQFASKAPSTALADTGRAIRSAGTAGSMIGDALKKAGEFVGQRLKVAGMDVGEQVKAAMAEPAATAELGNIRQLDRLVSLSSLQSPRQREQEKANQLLKDQDTKLGRIEQLLRRGQPATFA